MAPRGGGAKRVFHQIIHVYSSLSYSSWQTSPVPLLGHLQPQFLDSYATWGVSVVPVYFILFWFCFQGLCSFWWGHLQHLSSQFLMCFCRCSRRPWSTQRQEVNTLMIQVTIIGIINGGGFTSHEEKLNVYHLSILISTHTEVDFFFHITWGLARIQEKHSWITLQALLGTVRVLSLYLPEPRVLSMNRKY